MPAKEFTRARVITLLKKTILKAKWNMDNLPLTESRYAAYQTEIDVCESLLSTIRSM